MVGAISFILVGLSFSYGEVTKTGSSQYTSILMTQAEKRLVVQRRNNLKREVPTFIKESDDEEPVVTVQGRETYFRGPTSGSRATAVEGAGGQAATQTCGGPIEILDMQGRCEELVYDEDFLRVLQTEGLACAREAGREAFGFTPTKVGLRTLQGQVSAARRSSNGKRSTHSVGRALDIFEIDIYNGQAHNSIMMHGSYMDRRGHRTFYTSFRDCWKDVVRAARGGSAGTCGSGCLHFDSNAAHWNHMHISLPPLDTNRRSYGLNCT